MHVIRRGGTFTVVFYARPLACARDVLVACEHANSVSVTCVCVCVCLCEYLLSVKQGCLPVPVTCLLPVSMQSVSVTCVCLCAFV